MVRLPLVQLALLPMLVRPQLLETRDESQFFDGSCDPSSGVSVVGGIKRIGGPASDGCDTGWTCATRKVVMFHGLKFPFGCVDDSAGLIHAAAANGASDRVKDCADAAFKGKGGSKTSDTKDEL